MCANVIGAVTAATHRFEFGRHQAFAELKALFVTENQSAAPVDLPRLSQQQTRMTNLPKIGPAQLAGAIGIRKQILGKK